PLPRRAEMRPVPSLLPTAGARRFLSRLRRNRHRGRAPRPLIPRPAPRRGVFVSGAPPGPLLGRFAAPLVIPGGVCGNVLGLSSLAGGPASARNIRRSNRLVSLLQANFFTTFGVGSGVDQRVATRGKAEVP